MAVLSNVFLILLFSSCWISLIDHVTSSGITVDLIHRDSSLSPTYNPNTTRFDRLKRAFHRSFSRKASLKPTSYSPQAGSIEAPIQSNGGEYLMKITLGTPPVNILAIVDTGSDLFWTQCTPCPNCYKQTAPLFNPNKSTTYRDFSCKSEICAAAGGSSCDSKNNCEYSVTYGDSSYSNGNFAAETIGLQASGTEKSVLFPKTVFGCGHANAGTFNETGSGIIGLGGGSISIVKQLDSSFGGRFSYCLAQIDNPSVSKISFGSKALVSGPKVVSTPLIKKYPDTFYYLNLEGVSVGTTRLEYKTSNHKGSAPADAQGNIIIDSGTTLTFVPSQLYDIVESALIKAIKGRRVTDPSNTFNLCYRVKSGNFKAPPVVAHFTGAAVTLPPTSTFLEVEEGMYCLTLVPSQDLAIFGNLSQMDYLVGYDLVKNKVSFMPTDCSKDA